jgi:hypothetical protein
MNSENTFEELLKSRMEDKLEIRPSFFQKLSKKCYVVQ